MLSDRDIARAQIVAELDQLRARHRELLSTPGLRSGSGRLRRREAVRSLLIEIARLEGMLVEIEQEMAA